MLCMIYIYIYIQTWNTCLYILHEKTLHAQCVSYPHTSSVFSSSPSNNRPCLACCQRCGLCLYGCLCGISEGYISAKGDVWLGCCIFRVQLLYWCQRGGYLNVTVFLALLFVCNFWADAWTISWTSADLCRPCSIYIYIYIYLACFSLELELHALTCRESSFFWVSGGFRWFGR